MHSSAQAVHITMQASSIADMLRISWP
ncbi:MAG: hypothetical protein JWM51_132, partial [Microbacteriaceae bacterium]|nr:hypothetical protein [Microbacteriaceae bacterium]